MSFGVDLTPELEIDDTRKSTTYELRNYPINCAFSHLLQLRTKWIFELSVIASRRNASAI
jgi:hypothetical protein